jgi:cytoskeletal protein CcmA (bactofilin family)
VTAADGLTSVIAHSTSWSGTLESTGSLHVHGRVEGSLVARDDIFIAGEAEVDATLTAASVTIAGSVRGSIRCGQRFELLPHGRVAGDVWSPVVVIHEGAAIIGEIAMTESPDGKAATNASVAGGVRGGH